MSEKSLDDMTEAERMRHWMNIVINGDGELKAISESADSSQVTIIIQKKKKDPPT